MIVICRLSGKNKSLDEKYKTGWNTSYKSLDQKHIPKYKYTAIKIYVFISQKHRRQKIQGKRPDYFQDKNIQKMTENAQTEKQVSIACRKKSKFPARNGTTFLRVCYPIHI